GARWEAEAGRGLSCPLDAPLVDVENGQDRGALHTCEAVDGCGRQDWTRGGFQPGSSQKGNTGTFLKILTLRWDFQGYNPSHDTATKCHHTHRSCLDHPSGGRTVRSSSVRQDDGRQVVRRA